MDLSQLAILLLLTGVPGAHAADTTEVAATPHPGREAALARARRAQRTFEILRRNRLPWTSQGLDGRCDERVGRFCLAFSDDPDGRTDFPEEHEEVRRARHVLIDDLADARLLGPDDCWLTGQSIRYLYEAERIYEAEAVSDGCQADEEWCAALRGFVLHRIGRIEEAEEAYETMLALMDPEEREEWEAIEPLLDHEAWRRLSGLPPERIEAVRERFWWLADPLLSEPGNAAWTEHLSRRVIARLYSQSRTTDAVPWGRDLEELTIRYGTPVAHFRVRSRPHHRVERPAIVSHYGPGRRAFLPPITTVISGRPISNDDWELRRARARAVHGVPGLDRIDPLDSFRAAVFRRGTDSLLVVSSHAIDPGEEAAEGDEEPEDPDWRTVWAYGEPGDLQVQPHSRGAWAVSSLRIPARPTLMAVEARSGDGLQARRARWTVTVRPSHPDLVDLSDVLLLGPGTRDPGADLETLLSVAEPLGRVAAGSSLRLVWEVYGPPHRTADMEMSVALVGADQPSLLRRLGAALGLLGRPDAPSIRWGEELRAGQEGTTMRTAELAIPADLSAGGYVLRLTAQLPGRETLVREQRITVVEQ